MKDFFLLLGTLDPGPLFVISLFPYLIFLYWAQKASSIPKIALLGFRFTLIFVGVTIAFSIFAQVKYGLELTDIDPLHGSAEAFLAVSDALVVFGFLGLLKKTSE
ncbi:MULTISPECIES: DUF3593 domain-containing protein [unclassified Prochlorococcus]|uniref:DUF3593 domain-containing protein n=1 Tax=unclassified Prochlorococcus TaxID=2627481 RepID=UPI00053383F3|nr:MULTISPECIES: DUF3593 domain-containing protein [unclassified Prochlorococcus]KGG15250.1 hypothetical protein EV06_1121 [Prochlorococcus sp. MIT 0602]